jgi:hypothetical protein
MRNWLSDDEKTEEKIIPDFYKMDPETRKFHQSHRELLEYLAKKKYPAKGWELTFLRFWPDTLTPDTGDYVLSGFFVSRSRYNPKFLSEPERHAEEWKSYGLSFLKEWKYTFQELREAETGIRISVSYKYKNYLRPNERLKEGVLTFSIPVDDLNSHGDNIDYLYQTVLKRLIDNS